MGISQILLIVLSVIIVGVAISTGIYMLHQQNVSIHRQMMIARMNEIVAMALAHKETPASMGGGDGSYIGFTLAGSKESPQPGSNSPGGFWLEDTEVNYFVEWYFNNRLKIIASSKIFGEGKYWNNTYNARIEAVFDSNGRIDNKGFVITGDWK